MNEREFTAKYIGTTVESVDNPGFNDLVGKTVVAILCHKGAREQLALGNEPGPGSCWLLVENANEAAGKYWEGKYPTEGRMQNWDKFPHQDKFDYGRHLSELPIARVLTLKHSSDTYAVGPEGQTKGYLDGHTGLEFL